MLTPSVFPMQHTIQIIQYTSHDPMTKTGNLGPILQCSCETQLQKLILAQRKKALVVVSLPYIMSNLPFHAVAEKNNYLDLRDFGTSKLLKKISHSLQLFTKWYSNITAHQEFLK